MALEISRRLVNGVWVTDMEEEGAGGPISLDDLTDVDLAGGSDGDVLTQQLDGSYAPEAPTGGSSSIKAVDLGVIDIAAICAAGPQLLYAMQPGEFLSTVRFTDTDYEDIDALPAFFGVGTVKSFGWWSFLPIQPSSPINSWAGGGLNFWDTLALQIYSLGYDPRSAELGVTATTSGAMILSAAAAGDIYASAFIGAGGGNLLAPGDGSGVRLDAIAAWQATTGYDDLASTVATAGAIRNAAIIANGTVWWNTGAAGMSGGMSPDFAGNAGGTVTDGPDIVWADTSVAMPSTGKVHAIAEIWTPA